MNVTYNKKAFLLPSSPWSMASFHAMIEPEGACHFRIHDCKGGIHLWNDLTVQSEVSEFIEKMRCLAQAAIEFAEFIENNYVHINL